MFYFNVDIGVLITNTLYRVVLTDNQKAAIMSKTQNYINELRKYSQQRKIFVTCRFWKNQKSYITQATCVLLQQKQVNLKLQLRSSVNIIEDCFIFYVERVRTTAVTRYFPWKSVQRKTY